MTFCERLGKILRDRNCEIENESDYLSSAVLVPLVRREGRLGVLFEVRSAALTWQPGDICFPGGRIELDDAGPEAAAVRETREELSLPDDAVDVIGPLNTMVSPIGVMIYPCGLYQGFRPDPAESRRSVGGVRGTARLSAGSGATDRPYGGGDAAVAGFSAESAGSVLCPGLEAADDLSGDVLPVWRPCDLGPDRPGVIRISECLPVVGVSRPARRRES